MELKCTIKYYFPNKIYKIYFLEQTKIINCNKHPLIYDTLFNSCI